MTHDMDLVIRNAHCATACMTFDCDIGVKDGVIRQLGGEMSSPDEIDANGRWVLPGGIDSHVHFDQRKTHGGQNADDFYTGTVSAACGGTTTVIPFAAQHRTQSVKWAIEEYHARATGNAVIDYNFHLILSDPAHPDFTEELSGVCDAGIKSLKVFTTYPAIRLDDDALLDIFNKAKLHGCLVMVHCENSGIIDFVTQRLLDQDMTAPKYHLASRPAIAEAEAVMRICAIAELFNVPTMIVHVSSGRSLKIIDMARDNGATIFAETCTQYLTLPQSLLDQPDQEGAKGICSPPLRSAAESEALWQAVCDGTLDVVSSDHSPYRFDETGKFAHGRDVPFTRISNGLPGVELRMPLFFTHAVQTGRIDINRFVALTSANAAEIYGLSGRKGTIAVGADADLCIWDDDYRWTINNDRMHHNVDFTPYEGMEVTAWPAVTLSRGRVVARYHDFTGTRGDGQFLVADAALTRHEMTATQKELNAFGLRLSPRQ
ncbi:MAG: dihydropyrimidinase [Mameliella sp.]|nr:dihydropyrimidinase [Mameliella sp.]|tara:strand:- start:1453 stop:2916 length:1464 start_codon:yes stop_codon:yes gene_type:complete